MIYYLTLASSHKASVEIEEEMDGTIQCRNGHQKEKKRGGGRSAQINDKTKEFNTRLELELKFVKK